MDAVVWLSSSSNFFPSLPFPSSAQKSGASKAAAFPQKKAAGRAGALTEGLQQPREVDIWEGQGKNSSGKAHCEARMSLAEDLLHHPVQGNAQQVLKGNSHFWFLYQQVTAGPMQGDGVPFLPLALLSKQLLIIHQLWEAERGGWVMEEADSPSETCPRLLCTLVKCRRWREAGCTLL